jgi:hypothetical protein
MSDTPRTDAATLTEPYQVRELEFEVVDAGEMARLERELNEANAQLRSLKLELKESYELKDSLVKKHLEFGETLKEANADRLRLRVAFGDLLLIYEKDNTSYDSYGVEGSDWPVCDICQAEGKPGIFSCGLPHDESCVVYKFQQALTTPPPPVVAKADADALADALETISCYSDKYSSLDAKQALETYRNKYKEGNQ